MYQPMQSKAETGLAEGRFGGQLRPGLMVGHQTARIRGSRLTSCYPG